jgi:hypothetical protein
MLLDECTGRGHSHRREVRPYIVNRKQYLVVAVTGGSYSGEHIAFSIPDDVRVTN